METNKHKIMKEWLKLLRDPKSKKAFGVLCQPDGAQCALGWLCQAAGLTPEVPPTQQPTYLTYEGEASKLPKSIGKIMKMTSGGRLKPRFDPDNVTSIAFLNDNEIDMSLAKIADVVEDAYENDRFIKPFEAFLWGEHDAKKS